MMQTGFHTNANTTTTTTTARAAGVGTRHFERR